MVSGPPPDPSAGRAAHVIAQLYYYVASVIGVGLLLGGAIGVLFGLRTIVLPREFEQARDGLRTILHSLSFAAPGGLLLWWHLREARRREGLAAVAAFWGRSLYFHLVALVALAFLLVGTVMTLSTLADLAVPHCFSQQFRPVEPPPIEAAPGEEGLLVEDEECHPSPAEAGRRIIDGLIFVVAAGPVWGWHLRQGRRATSPGGPPPAASAPPPDAPA